MRTTIELKDEHRARLLALAARKGLRGYSRVVEEAVDRYLREAEGREEVSIQYLRGILTDKEAAKFKKAVEGARKKWRS